MIFLLSTEAAQTTIPTNDITSELREPVTQGVTQSFLYKTKDWLQKEPTTWRFLDQTEKILEKEPHIAESIFPCLLEIFHRTEKAYDIRDIHKFVSKHFSDKQSLLASHIWDTFLKTIDDYDAKILGEIIIKHFEIPKNLVLAHLLKIFLNQEGHTMIFMIEFVLKNFSYQSSIDSALYTQLFERYHKLYYKLQLSRIICEHKKTHDLKIALYLRALLAKSPYHQDAGRTARFLWEHFPEICKDAVWGDLVMKILRHKKTVPDFRDALGSLIEEDIMLDIGYLTKSLITCFPDRKLATATFKSEVQHN